MIAVGMSEEAAAWVRENAWTQGMRKQHREVPKYASTCACQGGMTTHCSTDKCEGCHHQPDTSLSTWEAMICNRTGLYPVSFAAPYEHETQGSATGPHLVSYAMVWLDDRVCRWRCPHDCHAAPVAAARPNRYEAVMLPGFELVDA